MDSQYEQAVRYIQSNLAAGFAPDQLQRQLVQSGWEPQLVARALQQASYNLSNPQQQIAAQPAAATPARGLAQKPVMFVLLIIGGISVAIFLFIITNPSSNSGQTQSDAENTSQADETSQAAPETSPTEQQFSSSEANISFAYPLEWTVKELSPGTKDSFDWQVTPPTNGQISSQLEAEYNIVPSPNLSLSVDPAAADALADPTARELAIVDVQILREPTFTIEESLADWKDFIDDVSIQPDISFNDFQNIEVSGFEGLKYESVITLGGVEFSTVEYVVLTPSQRLEVSVFPANTNHIDLIDDLVNSFTFE